MATTPARAVSAEEIGKVIEFAAGAYEVYGALSGAPTELDLATQKIIGAVQAAEQAIINHIDGISAADVKACANAAVADVENLPVMSRTYLETYASNATQCVTKASQYVSALSDPVAINDVTFAMNTVGPLALLARTRLGYTSAFLEQQVIGANQTNITKLTPYCTVTPVKESGRIREYHVRCQAFNGTVGDKYYPGSSVPNYTDLIDQVMTGTSYQESKLLLPILTRPKWSRNTDMLWRRTDGSTPTVWRVDSQGQRATSKYPTGPHSGQVLATGDFDGDGYSDVLTRDSDGRAWVTYLRDGLVVGTPQGQANMTGASVNAVGDFNRNGTQDVVWRRPDGSVELWFSANSAQTARPTWMNQGVITSLDWQIKGAGDFNGDGYADLLWRNTSGQMAIWHLNGGSVIGGTSPGWPELAWQVAGVGDFDADARADILWRHTSGQLGIWFKGDPSITANPSWRNLGYSTGLDWRVAGVSDFNADGRSDILWHNTNSGQASIWFMNGGQFLSNAEPGTLDSGWRLEGLLARAPGDAN